MSNTQLDKIKDKLRKLIAKQESAEKLGNLAEAEAFASKISELMMEYQIELHELQTESAQNIDIDHTIFFTSDLTARNESDWIRRLYNACAIGANCKVLYHKGNLYTITIVGDEMSIETLHFMVAQLSVKLRTLARSTYTIYKKEGKTFDKRNTFIRSFLKGAPFGIKEQLESQRENYRKQEQTAGIVLASDARLNDYVSNHFRVGVAKMRNGSSRSGLNAGFEAGRNIDINKGVGSSARGAGGTKLLG